VEGLKIIRGATVWDGNARIKRTITAIRDRAASDGTITEGVIRYRKQWCIVRHNRYNGHWYIAMSLSEKPEKTA